MASLAPYDYELDPRNQTFNWAKELKPDTGCHETGPHNDRANVEDLLDRTAATIVAAFFLGASVLLFALVVYKTLAA